MDADSLNTPGAWQNQFLGMKNKILVGLQGPFDQRDEAAADAKNPEKVSLPQRIREAFGEYIQAKPGKKALAPLENGKKPKKEAKATSSGKPNEASELQIKSDILQRLERDILSSNRL